MTEDAGKFVQTVGDLAERPCFVSVASADKLTNLIEGEYS
jgi:hypothetical protein